MKKARPQPDGDRGLAGRERRAGLPLPGLGPAGPADAAWVASQRKWGRGWRGVVFPGVFCAYLISVVSAVHEYSHGAAAVGGYAIVGVFVVAYLSLVPGSRPVSGRQFWSVFAALAALTAAEVQLARASAFVMCVFLATILVARLGVYALPVVAGMTMLAVVVPAIIPSWHDSPGTSLANGTVIAIPLVALAMIGFFGILRGNRALAEARAELARLAAENERTRIARDLHDLLGHSLTTITVKAQLARRLGEHDTGAALREIAEVEALSRRALADVRATVASYREMTLAGELASGGELLRAAGIAADLPPVADAVQALDAGAQELFGWVLREGLTNVARHSRARSCTVRISGSSVEITDDGVGGEAGTGAGLAGLRERVEAAGGVLEAAPLRPRGWRLLARLT
jgi:two-component system, NarL family, sensor histidine kinase DesK